MSDLLFLRANFLDAATRFPRRPDLIVTSPPYNLGMPYPTWDDSLSEHAYSRFTLRWLTKARKIAADHGRLAVNLPLDQSGGRSIYADFVRMAKEVGWRYFSTICWHEGNVSKRTAWGSFRLQTAPYVMSTTETIAIFSKNGWKRERPEGFEMELGSKEFQGLVLGDWKFNGESAKRIGHPAPFPVELPRRLVKLLSFKGDLVLDPFAGSGSTLIACGELGRDGIGVDLDYVSVARGRLREAGLKARFETRV